MRSTAFTEPSGEYTVPFLALGEYEIAAEASGFKKSVRKGITLSAGEHPVIDMKLEIGAVSDTVTVTADAPLLVTANPSVGQVITTAEVEDFPINGRTPMMLDNLALGVISTYEPGPVRPFDNGAPNSVSIGGASSGRNEVLLNGSPNAGFSNQMAYSPMQDSVQEVRVNVFDMDASFGHTMGGTINLITKSGTNGLHGTASIFNQTSELDANSFFNNKNNVTRPSYHQNQWGVNGGGPLFIPKVFNGKNRVFWFFGLEGMRDSDPATSPVETGSPENYTTVPTAAERTGDFSALLTVNQRNPSDKTNYTIYDPNTGVMNGTLVQRTPFPGNVIPTARLNGIAKNYLQYFPQPNITGQANGQQNFITNAIDSDGYDNELGKLDVSTSDRNRLSFDVHHNFRRQNKNDYFGTPATGNFLYRINQGASLDDVYTITPTLVADVRLNYSRYQEHHFSPADNVSPTSLGFPSYIAGNAEWQMMPYIVFTSTSVSAGSRYGFEPMGYNSDGTNYSDSWQLFGQVSKVKGNHNIKFGTDLRQYQWSIYSFGNPSGTMTFGSTTGSSNWTNSPYNSNTFAIGQDMAAFLLGLPTSGSIDLNAQSTVRARYFSFFIHDDWRVKNNLTVNLGLRWDHDTPETEWHNRSVNGFDPNAANSVSTTAAAAYAAAPYSLLPASQFHALGGLTFASASNRNIYDSKSHILSPRFGFAWTPAALGNKTVLRGGVGVLVDPTQTPSPNQPGFSQNTSMNVSNDSRLTPYGTLSDPYPGGAIQHPTGSALGASTFLDNSITFYNPAIRNPYVVRWELSVQRQLPGAMVLEVAYIGNHGMHQLINRNVDTLPRQYLATSLLRDNATINMLTSSTVTNPFKGLIGSGTLNTSSTTTPSQILLPFPQFTGITEQSTNAGSSYYESLNIRLQKRFTHGLTLMNNFIKNRLEDRLAYLNDTDPQPEKRLSSDSRPFRNVLAADYRLPIGRGRRINLQNRWLDSFVGGWAISGILTLQSGPALGWGNMLYMGGPLNLKPHQPNGLAFDTTRFDTLTADQLANNIRYFDTQFNNLRRDMVKQLDNTLTKSFKFTESGKQFLQVRFEAFNLTNRVTFGSPQLSPTNSAFGQISSQANTPRRIESGLKLVW